jgi:hypothetical protein
MVKIMERKRAGSFRRLVVMHEKEYDDLRKTAALKSEHSGRQLVEKYLGPEAQPGLSASERLSLFNQAAAREEAGHLISDGRYVTTSTTKTATTNKEGDLQAAAKQDTQQAQAQAAIVGDETLDDQAKVNKEEEEPTQAFADANVLPDANVPGQYETRLSALKTVLEASNTVSVDKQGRVYVDHNLLDDKSNYNKLMRSLFVQSTEGDNLPGRVRFLQHLHKLGISEKQVSARTAKTLLHQLRLQQQLGEGRKRAPYKFVRVNPPPGKQPKVLRMYQ